jgi:transposase
LWTFFKMPISLGSVTACEQEASEAVATPVEEAREYVKQQAVKHADESSWFEGPKRAKVWLWTVTTPLVTVFLIWASRGKDVARKILGEAFGVLVTDRWCAYNWWPLEWRQLCWSHIKRHWEAMIEAGGKTAEIGKKLQEQRARLFELWGRVWDGTLKRSTFRRYVAPIRAQIRDLLAQGSTCPHAKSAGMCSELLKVEEALYTFVRVEGVEPTNNSAERAIRPGVIWRNLCFGTHSRWGSRFVGRILTVVQTLKQQKRDALAFVTVCVDARRRGLQPASLLPTAQ